MMHIGLLAPAWPYGSQPNGIVTYAHFLRDGLIEIGHRVTIFSGAISSAEQRPDVCPIPADGRLGMLLRRLVGRSHSAFDGAAPIASAVRRRHRVDPLDVFEMEETFGWAGTVAKQVAVPVVVRLHGPAHLSLSSSERGTDFGMRRISAEGASLAKLSSVTAPSTWTLSQTLRHYGVRPRNAAVVANPIDGNATLPLWDFNGVDRNRVLFIGRFDNTKGGDLALLTFQKLVRHRPELRMSFVGPDRGLLDASGKVQSFAQYVEGLRDPALSNAIEFFGQQPPASISAMRAKAAVVLVTSRQENQPYAALEAMLQGCPLVCTDTSGLSELILHGETGLKARAEDPNDLAARVEEILASPTLAKSIGGAAREYVRSHHSRTRVAQATVDVYRNAAALA